MAIALLAVVVAGLLTLLTVPQYATSVTFFVTTPSQGLTDAYQGGLFSQQRVKSYSTLLAGDRLARAIAADPAFGLDAAEVQKRISARVVPDTVLLQATVVDTSKERSQKIAEALARHFESLIGSLETPPNGNGPMVKVEVVAGPTLEPVPVAPRPTRNLGLALVLGLLCGVGASVLREALDSTVKSGEALHALTGSPILAIVPFDAAAARSPLLTEVNAYCSRGESLRHLRTNLQFVDAAGPVRAFVVTSAVPGEGKSTTAANVAITFAQANNRVLLIEADLRRPKVAEYLGLEGAVGLSNVLAGQVEVAEVLQRWGPHELWVLPSGSIPPNPSELLGSQAMSQLLARQREQFDVVIIDTPPLMPVTDAAVVAAISDGAVVVTRSGKTPQAQIRIALTRLRAVNARVLGCVLNMQPGKGKEGYYYTYSGKQDTPQSSKKKNDAGIGLVRVTR